MAHYRHSVLLYGQALVRYQQCELHGVHLDREFWHPQISSPLVVDLSDRQFALIHPKKNDHFHK